MYADLICRTSAYPTSVTDHDNFVSTARYYYEIGAITRTQDTKGAVDTRQYDNIGRIERVENQFTSGYLRWYYTVVAGVTSYASGMKYRAFGGLKQMNYANGRNLSLSYNSRMFLTQWSIPSVMGWNYKYHYFNENTGRVVYAQNLNDPTLDRSYDYDHVGRAVHFTSGSNARHHTGQGGTPLNDGPYSQSYGFDVWGNRTSMEGWGGIGRTETASYTNNRRNGFTYDAAGNLTNDQGQTFTYDATGQQATASYSGYLLQQTYDGDRLRVKKVENGTTTYYLRSTVLGGQIVAELSGAGAFTRGFVYLGGELLAVQQNNQVSWVHQDPVAKSKRVTDSAGNVVSTIELDPWGGDTNRSSNEAFQPRRFTTYDRDGNASDEAMHRRYNRWHSRFDQPDPYGGSYDMTNPQSFNRFSYVLNDPVNFVDPSGLDDDCPQCVNDPDDAEVITFSTRARLFDSSGLFNGDTLFLPELPPTEGEPEGPGGAVGRRIPQLLNLPQPQNCKQDKTGGDQDDILDLLGRAGLSGQISNVSSAGPKNPEGIIFEISNRQAFVAILDADSRFRRRTPFGGEHATQVGANRFSVLDYRSFTTPDGLGRDSTGHRRSLQVDVGPRNRAGGALGYADLDCDNPAQDVVSGARHGFPIIFRRLGSIFRR